MNASFDRPNALCGAIFVALGAYFGITSLTLEIGTPFRMGPGFFPLFLAVILTGLGLIVVGQSFRGSGEQVGAIAWRGMIFILPAPIVFGLTVRGLGFVPAIFITAFIAAFASTRMKIPLAAALAAVMTVFATIVFAYGLGLPFRLFGPWLGL